ncbi:MAG: hypothetical protein WBC55_05960 [Dehalococcoidia bacterium]
MRADGVISLSFVKESFSEGLSRLRSYRSAMNSPFDKGVLAETPPFKGALTENPPLIKGDIGGLK